MTAPNGFPGIDRIESMHTAEPAVGFRTIRIKVSGTDRYLQLGTMAAAHIPGTLPFKTDETKAAEFPSIAVAQMVLRLIEDRLNAAGATRWSLVPEICRHETTDSWTALYRMERTALETFYLLAEVLPKWVKR